MRKASCMKYRDKNNQKCKGRHKETNTSLIKVITFSLGQGDKEILYPFKIAECINQRKQEKK